jgi:hypothetical protein
MSYPIIVARIQGTQKMIDSKQIVMNRKSVLKPMGFVIEMLQMKSFAVLSDRIFL